MPSYLFAHHPPESRSASHTKTKASKCIQDQFNHIIMPCALHFDKISGAADFLPPLSKKGTRCPYHPSIITPGGGRLRLLGYRLYYRKHQWLELYSNSLDAINNRFQNLCSHKTIEDAPLNFRDGLDPKVKAVMVELIIQIHYWDRFLKNLFTQRAEHLKTMSRYHGLDEEKDRHMELAWEGHHMFVGIFNTTLENAKNKVAVAGLFCGFGTVDEMRVRRDILGGFLEGYWPPELRDWIVRRVVEDAIIYWKLATEATYSTGLVGY